MAIEYCPCGVAAMRGGVCDAHSPLAMDDGPTETLSQAELLRLLQQRVREAGSQRQVAQSIGVSPAFLSDVLKGRRYITGALLHWLGYREERVYKRVYRPIAAASTDASAADTGA